MKQGARSNGFCVLWGLSQPWPRGLGQSSGEVLQGSEVAECSEVLSKGSRSKIQEIPRFQVRVPSKGKGRVLSFMFLVKVQVRVSKKCSKNWGLQVKFQEVPMQVLSRLQVKTEGCNSKPRFQAWVCRNPCKYRSVVMAQWFCLWWLHSCWGLI